MYLMINPSVLWTSSLKSNGREKWKNIKYYKNVDLVILD